MLSTFKSFFVTKFEDPRIRRLFTITFFSGIGFVVFNGVLRLFVFPFLSRILGEERFGDFLVDYSFCSMLSVIPATAVMTAMVRLHSSYTGKAREIFFKTISVFALSVSPIIAVLFWLLTEFLDGFFKNVNLRAFNGVLAFYLAFYFLYTIFGGMLGCRRRYIAKSVFDTSAGLLFLVIVPVFYLLGRELVPFSFLTVFCIIVFSQLLTLRGLFKAEYQMEWAVIKLILKMSPFFMAACVMEVFLQYGSRWVLAYYLDAKAVSAYYAGMSIILMFIMPVSMLSQLQTLVISQKDKVTDLRWSDLKLLIMGAVTLAVGLPVIAYIFGKPVMVILYGKGLATKGFGVFNILFVVLFLYPLRDLVRPFIVKYCRLSVPLVFATITAIVALGVSIFLVPRIGIKGAAIAICISVGISCSLYLTQFIRSIAVPVYRYRKNVESEHEK